MTVQQPRGFHPWHDIPTGRRPPHELTAVIEIPTNERNKYELDKEHGIYRLDRVLHSAVHYPGDYAFRVPSTSFTWWTAAWRTKRCWRSRRAIPTRRD